MSFAPAVSIEVQDLADFKRRTSHFAEFAQNFVNTFAAKGMGKEINRSSLPRTKNEANGGSLLKVFTPEFASVNGLNENLTEF